MEEEEIWDMCAHMHTHIEKDNIFSIDFCIAISLVLL